MGDTLDKTDDAPLTTSKQEGAAVDAATETLIDAPGNGRADTLVGRAVTINRPLAALGDFGEAYLQVEGGKDAARQSIAAMA